MTGPNFNRHSEEDARLIILKHLAEQSNYTCNETMLDEVLTAFGHDRSRDWVRTQIRKLEELGAVTVASIGSVLVPSINQAGLDHVLRRSTIEGVRRPSPNR